MKSTTKSFEVSVAPAGPSAQLVMLRDKMLSKMANWSVYQNRNWWTVIRETWDAMEVNSFEK